jgi:hypothetical protein
VLCYAKPWQFAVFSPFSGSKMSKTAKNLTYLFLILALVAVGDDLYIWQTSDNYPFAFAALGWLAKHYAPEQMDMVVEFMGVDLFNQIFAPILRIPAFFMALGLAGVVFVVDIIRGLIKTRHLAKMPPAAKYGRSIKRS